MYVLCGLTLALDGCAVLKGGGAWRGKEKKYEYGIRHLYGEEGAKRDYRYPHSVALQKIGQNSSVADP
jgi:hypothetical protein